MERVKVFETGNRFGNMNSQARFYPEGSTREEINAWFLARRMMVGREFGFDGHKMFMADQVNKNGSYFEITDDYVEANPNGWSDIPEDILIITDSVPGVVIGHAVADCPVVMMEDPIKGVSAVAHCSCEMIDKRLPMMVADALVNAYGSNEEDIITYVSACAGDSWTYDTFPKWATDTKMWEDGIYEENGAFHIDMRKVIRKQLSERHIDLDNVTFNMDDTIINPNYYSNSAASPYGLNDSSKAGRHFAGLFYPKGKMLMKYKEK
jgi:hypothetical protein